MTRKTRILIAIALTVPELLIPALIYLKRRHESTSLHNAVMLMGAVLRADSDETKQTPLGGVRVSARAGKAIVAGVSDTAGRFQLQLTHGDKPVLLTFQSAGYKTMQISATKPADQIYIARLEALENEQRQSHRAAYESKIEDTRVVVRNVRVRYSFKDESSISVGSFAKQFIAPNSGNRPCNGKGPCSPDGRWKATSTIFPLDAEQGNEFRNVRVSCIAGPCAFTKIDADTFEHPARTLSISVLNWSDVTVFLVEADVTRSMVAERVRESYPFVIARTMTFSLPASTGGLSIEANVANEQIVYPLGPLLVLSWATCSVEPAGSGNSIYRCVLKPGYRFQPS